MADSSEGLDVLGRRRNLAKLCNARRRERRAIYDKARAAGYASVSAAQRAAERRGRVKVGASWNKHPEFGSLGHVAYSAARGDDSAELSDDAVARIRQQRMAAMQSKIGPQLLRLDEQLRRQVERHETRSGMLGEDFAGRAVELGEHFMEADLDAQLALNQRECAEQLRAMEKKHEPIVAAIRAEREGATRRHNAELEAEVEREVQRQRCVKLYERRCREHGVACCRQLLHQIGLDRIALPLYNLSPAHATVLGPVVASLRNTVALLLPENCVGDEGCAALASALRSNSVLRVLDLRRNAIGSVGGTALLEALGGEGNNSTLQELCLAQNSIGAAMDGWALANGLLKPEAGLGKRAAPHAAIVGSERQLCNALRVSLECGPLTSLDLSSNALTPNCGVALGAALGTGKGKIRVLDLRYNDLRGMGVQSIAVGACGHPTLSTLDLGLNSLGDGAAVALGRALLHEKCALRTLRLAESVFTEAGAAGLSSAIAANKTLCELDLRGCVGLDFGGGVRVIEALGKNDGTLESLQLDSTPFSASVQRTPRMMGTLSPHRSTDEAKLWGERRPASIVGSLLLPPLSASPTDEGALASTPKESAAPRLRAPEVRIRVLGFESVGSATAKISSRGLLHGLSSPPDYVPGSAAAAKRSRGASVVLHRSTPVTTKACVKGLRCLAQFTKSENAPWYVVEVIRSVPGGMGAADKAELRVLEPTQQAPGDATADNSSSNVATVDVANLRIVPSDVAVLELSVQRSERVSVGGEATRWTSLGTTWFPRASLPTWVGTHAPNNLLYATARAVPSLQGYGERFDFTPVPRDGSIAGPEPNITHLDLFTSDPERHPDQTPIVIRWSVEALPPLEAIMPSSRSRPSSQQRSLSTGKLKGKRNSRSTNSSSSRPGILFDFYRDQGSITSQMRLLAREYSGRQEAMECDLRDGRVKVSV